MLEDKNHLGLDKFQLTIIKGNYASMKPSIARRNKALEKINETTQKFKEKLETAVASLRKEAEAYEKQISMLDTFALETTERTCGIALTTEQVMYYLDNPDKWEEKKRELQGADMFNEQFSDSTEPAEDTQEYHENLGEGRDLDAEEDADWQEKLDSGELVEVNEVHFHMPDGEVVDVPVVQEAV